MEHKTSTLKSKYFQLSLQIPVDRSPRSQSLTCIGYVVKRYHAFS